MQDNNRDLIIIGAGINGLAAGLAWTRNSDPLKNRVLIVEKNAVSGGYVTSFTRKGYEFDTCQMASNVTDILKYLGVDIDFHEFRNDFIKVFKAEPAGGKITVFELCSGEGTFEDSFFRLFPTETPALQRFFAYSLAMFREIYGLKYDLGMFDILKMLITCPKVVRNRNKTFSRYLRIFGISNPDIELLFQVFSSMCGLPNDRIAALLTVGVMCSLREQAYRTSGPFIDLTRKMEERYRELGGEILLKSEVTKILVENGAVQGIRLRDGTEYYSRNVISTIDVKVTVNGLVGLDTIRARDGKYAEKVASLEMTTSSFTVNLGLDDGGILADHGLPCGYGLLTTGVDAFPKLYAAFRNNDFSILEDSFHLGYSCPPPEAGKKPVLSIQTIPIPVGDWVHLRDTDRKRYTSEKERVADRMIDIFERYLVPGLRDHIVVRDICTPATYVRYSGSPTGSIYDMASVPANFGANRLPVRSPVKGLLLPKFAHGVFGAMNSGLQAVDMLLNGRVMQGNSRFRK